MHLNVLCVLVNTRFQVLFHSPPGVLFTFPSRYCSTIGHWVVFRLGGWSPRLPTGFPVSGGTLDPARLLSISPTGLSPPMVWLPSQFGYLLQYAPLSETPRILLPLVWPLPRSLATTCGISVDFSSSPYLDVSVQAVPLICLWIQHMIHGLDPMWVSPFGHPRITDYLHLPAAFRSLSRPSSAPSAKAFPLCSF